MDKIINWIKSRGVSLYLILGAAVSGLVSFILYLATGVTSFAQSYSPLVIICFVIGMICAIAALIIKFRPLTFIGYIAFLAAALEYIISQINYIVNVLVGIDGETLSASFFATLIFALAAFVCMAVAFGLTKKKPSTEEA